MKPSHANLRLGLDLDLAVGVERLGSPPTGLSAVRPRLVTSVSLAPAARPAVLPVRGLVIPTVTVASTPIGGVTAHARPDTKLSLVTAPFLAAHHTSSALVRCRALHALPPWPLRRPLGLSRPLRSPPPFSRLLLLPRLLRGTLRGFLSL